MKRFLSIFVPWILLIILLPVQQASAQHGDPPPLPADAWKGQVSGKVVNQTTGEIVAEPVEVMLHAWNTENQERLMLHGKAEPDGTFRFEDVDFHQSFSYSVMATYLGATYFSHPASVQKGETSLTLDAQVYDTTDDLSSITIDQLHVLFYLEEGQLGITQLYAISNSSLLTVKDAVTLPRDRMGTLKFHLPDEAANVNFGSDSGDRYVLLAGGFADTAPIPPGHGVSQVIVGYNLPYTGKLDYTYMAPVAAEGVSFLVLEGAGLSLEGNGLTPAGERTLQDGSKFNIYTAPSLKPGESIQLTLSGSPAGLTKMYASSTQDSGITGIGIGAGVLGLSMVGVGVWWWRWRKEEATEEISEDTVEGILAEIQSLDLAKERDELTEEEYQNNRTALHDRLKAAANPSLP